MINNEEVFLGTNLNRAKTLDSAGRCILVLDGREYGNPDARREAARGTYLLTRREGSAPGDVDYWGVRA
ncbi:MAG: hypothetical protein HC897_15420 [Thermoanaerobaculia bacterium]|nr:hypothetical protein [Thermoanaerobaculia bacterium]